MEESAGIHRHPQPSARTSTRSGELRCQGIHTNEPHFNTSPEIDQGDHKEDGWAILSCCSCTACELHVRPAKVMPDPERVMLKVRARSRKGSRRQLLLANMPIDTHILHPNHCTLRN